MTIEDLLARFERPTRSGNQWLVKCPAHDDRKASLAITTGEAGRILLHCHAGCALAAIVAALGLAESDLFPSAAANTTGVPRDIVATYDYKDVHGGLLYQVVRYAPKDFRQRRPDGAGGWTWKLNGVARVVYRLSDLTGRDAVVIGEGEKDVDRLWQANIPATCNVGGAGKWRDEYAFQLKMAGVQRVRIIPDNDAPGRDHADRVARSCLAAGVDARIVTLPDLPAKGDVSDYLATHAPAELRVLLKAAPPYVPVAATDLVIPGEAPTGVPIVLADVLRDLMAYLAKYVVLAREQATAIVLWVVHTHALAAADCTPYLQITSATKQAGKTRLLEVLEHVVARPWFTGRTSAAALVRKVDADQPTLLLDESDATFNGEKEYAEALRGILNSGYRRSGRTTLCVGQGANMSYRDFVTFGAKAIAGIGTLPDTIADRSITIKLQRKKTDEPCARWRDRYGRREAAPFYQACRKWATPQVIAACRAMEPSLPATLSDRQADVWEPLLAIADEAGGDWPTRARQAATVLSGQAEDTDVTVELLRDIAEHVLDDCQDAPILSTTKDLIPTLVAVEDRPWASWRHDKPISARGLARLLGPLGIYPTTTTGLRGYRRDAFTDAIARYLPSYVSMRHAPNKTGAESPIPMCHSDPVNDAWKSSKKPVDIDVMTHGHIEAGERASGARSDLAADASTLFDQPAETRAADSPLLPAPALPERFEL